ncbi:MAG: NAD+ synthase [Verrucomicrobiales bacterium]
MKVGMLQLNSTIGNFPANTEKLLAGYREACEKGAEWVVAPELFLCGYPPRDLLHRSDFIKQNLEAVQTVADQVGQTPLFLGYVDWNRQRPGKALRNAAAAIQNGKVVQTVYKSLLPTYDVFDEDRYFQSASSISPISINGKKIGITICEDIWNDEHFWPERLYGLDPVRELVQAGAEVIFNLSASPWHRGKERTRINMLQRVATDEKVPLVQVNLVGANDELIFDGHSVAIDSRGAVIHLGKSFQEEVAVVDLSQSGTVSLDLLPKDNESLYAALTLGIKDYIGKCGFKSAILGLSGGIDSAITAVLAVEALGPQNVMGVAMPTRYSSSGSLTDAEALARNLGIRYEVLPIEKPFGAMEDMLTDIFHGTKPNEAEENLQSRLRGVTLMALSNKFGGLVLTTGNKSEMAVGYCTLYGDMCGALAPIADLFKTEIYSLARWINRNRVIIPPDTIEKPPSAELRPNQTDQDSLPPYDKLDAILDAYVVKNASRAEIISMGFPEAMVNDIINKVTFTEYKRRQAAPALKVSARAFGSGRRIPVAQRFRT